MTRRKIEWKPLSWLKPYENNPRNNDAAVDAVSASIKEFGFNVPIVADEDGCIVTGHTRYLASKKLGLDAVPTIIVDDLTPQQVKAFRLVDNKTSELADWDFEKLMADLDALNTDYDVDMSIFGFDLDIDDLDFREEDSPSDQNSRPAEQNHQQKQADWFESRDRFDTSREIGNAEYNSFVEKFEPKKTTDDCYTPDVIYDAVADWVANEYNLDRKNFVRPFFPGGDYQSEKYAKDSIVVDNPPFSIESEIIKFYAERGVKFFLFCSGLTALSSSAATNGTVLATGVGITYENKAVVATSFITNLEPQEIVMKTAPSLYAVVDKANGEVLASMHAELPKYSYPDEIVTAAMMNRYAKYGIDYIVRKDQSQLIRQMDAQKEYGKAIFGSGLILSKRAAAERAAAERAAAHRWTLSPKEVEIVERLSENDG